MIHSRLVCYRIKSIVPLGHAVVSNRKTYHPTKSYRQIQPVYQFMRIPLPLLGVAPSQLSRILNPYDKPRVLYTKVQGIQSWLAVEVSSAPPATSMCTIHAAHRERGLVERIVLSTGDTRWQRMG